MSKTEKGRGNAAAAGTEKSRLDLDDIEEMLQRLEQTELKLMEQLDTNFGACPRFVLSPRVQ